MTGAPSLRVLVVTADLGGNLSPALIIASRLIAEGAAVHVLGHSTQRPVVEAAGVTFSEYTRVRDYPPSDPRSSSLTGLLGLHSTGSATGVSAPTWSRWQPSSAATWCWSTTCCWAACAAVGGPTANCRTRALDTCVLHRALGARPDWRV